MAQLIVPTDDNADQETIDLYLSVFDTASVDNRMTLLARAGLTVEPATKVRALGMRSLTWATAAEVGLHALTTAEDPDSLALADAAVAALRVARGLAEDRRSVEDPFIDELLVTAHTLTSEVSRSEGLTRLHAGCRRYREVMRTGMHSVDEYLDALHSHSNCVTGVLLQELELVDPEYGDDVRTFAVALGVLYQLTSDLSAPSQPGLQQFSISRDTVSTLMATKESRDQITGLIVAQSRVLLQASKEMQRVYARSPLLDEIIVRANITLRNCATLLKQAKNRKSS